MGFPYTKTTEDEEQIKHDLETNRTLRHLKDANYYKFSVGDVLVRQDIQGNNWNTRIAQCGLPYKYVYVFENELGIGYIRRVSVDGSKFVEKPVCVLDFDPDHTRFILDPDYADYLLLSPDEPFDLKTDYKAVKKKRENMYRRNDKIAENTDTAASIIAWMQNLKKGDSIWWGHYRTSVAEKPYTVVAALEVNMTNLGQSKITLLPYWRNNYPDQFTVDYFVGKRIYLTKPLVIQDIVS